MTRTSEMSNRIVARALTSGDTPTFTMEKTRIGNIS